MKKLKKQSGFTLLELIVVVAVLGLVTSLATDFMINDTNQKRYELTKDRWNEIKFSIIGDSQTRVGSQPYLSGFFNDMGRLPRNLKELLESPVDDAATYPNNGLCIQNYVADELVSNETACNLLVPSGVWVVDTIEIGFWKGPYISNIQSVDGGRVFRDAWGNKSNDDNFGWRLDSSLATGDLIVESYGLDRTDDIGIDDGSGGWIIPKGYDADYPSAVAKASPVTTQYIVNKAELDRIKTIQDALIEITGYCIDTSAATVDHSITDSSSCSGADEVWTSIIGYCVTSPAAAAFIDFTKTTSTLCVGDAWVDVDL